MSTRILKLLSVVALTVALAIVASLAYQAASITSIETGDLFIEQPLLAQNNNLIDIGVVDFNADGYLDVFTVNHHSGQSLLQGAGDGSFVDVFPGSGLYPQPEFPGFAIFEEAPKTDKAGLYVYWQNRGLVLHWRPGSELPSLEGVLRLESPVVVHDSPNFRHSVTVIEEAGRLPKSVIEFAADTDGELLIETELLALPVHFTVSDDIDADRIYVGQNVVSPRKHSFSLFLNDRHGMAWADYDDDGRMDVFVSRGGLRGRMSQSRDTFYDELFRQTSTGFKNVIHDSGLEKRDCPGYNTQWVDYDRDGDLDLYVTCHHGQPNLLFRHEEAGQFTEIGGSINLGLENRLTDTPFLWVDIDQDVDLEILIADTERILVMGDNNGVFEPEAQFAAQGVTKMSPNDYDNDGDIDVLISSYFGSTAILKNVGGVLQWTPANGIGLPEFTMIANWVDFDNDGSVDVHAVPGGLFRQTSGEFQAAGLLSHRFPKSVKRARSSWFDMDNDGDLDLVMAVNYESPVWKIAAYRLLGAFAPAWAKPPQRNWTWAVRLFENKANEAESQNNWVQLELDDPTQNPQSIGASVTLTTTDRQTIASVGQSEGSLMSQGHYRLYFGLGEVTDPPVFEVKWPDGTTSFYSPNRINSRIDLSKPRPGL
jgi:hypothetical protein